MWQGFIRTQQQDGRISELLPMRIVTIFTTPSLAKHRKSELCPLKRRRYAN